MQIDVMVGRLRCLPLLCTVALILLAGCISHSPDDAPDIYLQPSGWRDIDDQLKAPDFAAYQQAVINEVRSQRIPFDAAQSAREVNWVSPVEIPPSAECNGQQRGIALLVHGLSDTAFAMHDLGYAMSESCLRARIVLLPGHGTRPGDLIDIRLSDWTRTLDYLIEQAAAEDEHIVLAGFSLGAALTMSAALDIDSPVDALIAVSPAYSLSSWRLARWAPWFYWLRPWVDRELPDDAMRYEAMPTRGVAETVRAMKTMRRKVAHRGLVAMPWLLVQSADDAVTVPIENLAFFDRYADNPLSEIILFVGPETDVASPAEQLSEVTKRITRIPGFDVKAHVLGLTHTAIHIAPDNPHYGVHGEYRNCGGTARRQPELVANCLSTDELWYGLWDQYVEPGRAQAISTFNPNFKLLTEEMTRFIESAIPYDFNNP